MMSVIFPAAGLRRIWHLEPPSVRSSTFVKNKFMAFVEKGHNVLGVFTDIGFGIVALSI